MLHPNKNKLIVELLEKEKTTESGIILTSADPVEASRGLVLFVGPDCQDIRIDDIILPDWNKATKFKYDNKDLFLVNENDVVGIFD